MPMNAVYRGPADLPGTIPVFPLSGALLLPRGQMPLNIFEPRYLEMVDDALRDGRRLIGMIQPDPAHPGTDHTREYAPLLVYGRSAKPGVNLGTRDSLADIGQTIAENFSLKLTSGESFLDDIS